MTGFLAQTLAAAALFAAIEGFESLARRLLPGRRRRAYALAKIAFGLPLVLVAGAALGARGVALDLPAAALGVIVAAAGALVLFGPQRGAATPEQKDPIT